MTKEVSEDVDAAIARIREMVRLVGAVDAAANLTHDDQMIAGLDRAFADICASVALESARVRSMLGGDGSKAREVVEPEPEMPLRETLFKQLRIARAAVKMSLELLGRVAPVEAENAVSEIRFYLTYRGLGEWIP